MRFVQGRVPRSQYYGWCYACRIAPHLRRPPPALYHLLVLSPIAQFANCWQAKPLSFDSGTNPPALPLRSRRMRRHAGALSSSSLPNRRPARPRRSCKSSNSAPRALSCRKENQPIPDNAHCFPRLSSAGPSGRRVFMTSTCGHPKSGSRSYGTCTATR